jgi:zinc/manganese transport system substrate-binding protein
VIDLEVVPPADGRQQRRDDRLVEVFDTLAACADQVMVVLGVARDVRRDVSVPLESARHAILDLRLEGAIDGRAADRRVARLDPFVQLLGALRAPRRGEGLGDDHALAREPTALRGHALGDLGHRHPSRIRAAGRHLTLSLTLSTLRLILRYGGGIMRGAYVLVVAALLVLASACAPAGAPSAPAGALSGEGIPVLGTENFYADLLAQIGGTRVTVSSILNDPSADPHEYEANPRTAKLVADAKLVILNGLGYDDFMDKLLGASTKPDRVVLNVQGILKKADDDNAHVWYDPATMPKVADAATAALSKLDPQNASYFAAQNAKYRAALKPIDDKIGSLKAKYSGAPVAFTEPVAEYQADAIGLTVLTPVGFMKAIEQAVDPAPADVAAERDLLTGRKVKVLLYNSQVTSPLTKDIHDLAVTSGVPVLGVAETIPPQFKTYREWMLAQLAELETALAK